jgi:predicted NAD/FAD-binding protein
VMLAEIVRFGRAARRLIAGARTAGAREAGMTLGPFLEAHHFRGAFVDRYLFPLAAAIWSASLDTLADFPALTLATFFDNHGMLDVLDHPTWRVVRGGSATYIPKLLASPGIVVHPSTPAARVTRGAPGVTLEFDARPPMTVDAIVFACHGDEVLPLLGDATPVEREVFGAFRTSTNDAWLHTDDTWLPTRPAARAAWNYLIGTSGNTGATVTYSLNRLQRLATPVEYCVTLNPPDPINPAAVIARMSYQHPLYTRAAVAAQARWAEVSAGRTHYAGAYWFYGFHEDGLRSAVRVAEALGVTW